MNTNHKTFSEELQKYKYQKGRDRLTTSEFADFVRVRPESIRHALCTKGHYLGQVPTKLPNGRLLW